MGMKKMKLRILRQPSALCILPDCGSSFRLKKRKQPLTHPGRMFLQNICVTMGRSL